MWTGLPAVAPVHKMDAVPERRPFSYHRALLLSVVAIPIRIHGPDPFFTRLAASYPFLTASSHHGRARSYPISFKPVIAAVFKSNARKSSVLKSRISS